jgi:hypothetical protein
MSKVAQIEAELEMLSQAELRQIRGLLDDLIEDELKFTPEFESAIQKSEREMSFSDLKIKRIETTADTLTVEIMDGRVLTVPLAYYPTLLHATDAERKNCHPIGAGYGIEWPALDYHLSVEGLMQGLPEAPGLRRAKALA